MPASDVLRPHLPLVQKQHRLIYAATKAAEKLFTARVAHIFCTNGFKAQLCHLAEPQNSNIWSILEFSFLNFALLVVSVQRETERKEKERQKGIEIVEGTKNSWRSCSDSLTRRRSAGEKNQQGRKKTSGSLSDIIHNLHRNVLSRPWDQRHLHSFR